MTVEDIDPAVVDWRATAETLQREVTRLQRLLDSREGEAARGRPPEERPHYMAVYRDFWQSLVEVNGRLDLDKVARELADYSHVLREYPTVLDDITGGLMSKTTYWARDILAEAHHVQEERINEAIAEVEQQ